MAQQTIMSIKDKFGWTTEVVYEGDADDSGANVVSINQFDKFEFRMVAVTRDEAIAAARAILKHFNVGVE